MSVVYVVVGIIQKTRPPVIGVYREESRARRMSADDRVHPVNDPCDAILKGADGMSFDDRDFIYDQLHEIVRH
jgi:hypothetical protein